MSSQEKEVHLLREFRQVKMEVEAAREKSRGGQFPFCDKKHVTKFFLKQTEVPEAPRTLESQVEVSQTKHGNVTQQLNLKSRNISKCSAR